MARASRIWPAASVGSMPSIERLSVAFSGVNGCRTRGGPPNVAMSACSPPRMLATSSEAMDLASSRRVRPALPSAAFMLAECR